MRVSIHCKYRFPFGYRRIVTRGGRGSPLQGFRSKPLSHFRISNIRGFPALPEYYPFSARREKSTVATSSAANPPTSFPLTTEEVNQVVTLLENDPRILMEVITQLNPENRRRLVVAGGAMEWFGAESAAQEVERADIDKDRQISPKDFDHWFQNALKRKMEQQKRKVASTEAGTTAGNLSSASLNSPLSSVTAGTPAAARQETPFSSPSRVSSNASSHVVSTQMDSCSTISSSAPSLTDKDTNKRIPLLPQKSVENTVTSTPPLRILIFVAMEAALPFVGFGFLDNAAMILAGDAIDNTLGFYLNCSVLASAAMGNVCSGLLGMQVHGLIEKAVRRVFPFAPVLTIEMMRHPRVFLAGHIGGTIGILIGLLLGMLPLLFLDTSSSDVEKSDYAIFQKMDGNNNGFVELAEFVKCLEELGVKGARERAQDLLSRFGDGSKITFEEFAKFRSELRDAKKNVLLEP